MRYGLKSCLRQPHTSLVVTLDTRHCIQDRIELQPLQGGVSEKAQIFIQEVLLASPAQIQDWQAWKQTRIAHMTTFL